MKKLCNFCQEIKSCRFYQFAAGACDDCHVIEGLDAHDDLCGFDATDPGATKIENRVGPIKGVYSGDTDGDTSPHEVLEWLMDANKEGN